MSILSSFLAVLLLWFLWFSFRYAWWRRTVPLSYPRILMYHQIAEHIKGARFNGLRVSPDMFEKQLIWLTENEWNFMTMAQLVKAKSELFNKTVVLTFDDGYEDNYTEAFPLMQKYNACGTLYLVVDRHDNDWSTKKKKHHDNGELARDKKLSDQQVKEMIDSGVFELGGHTHSHANLNQLDLSQKDFEINESKKKLEKIFNTEVTSFAYPFGIYNKGDVEFVCKSGYSNAVTTIDGIDGIDALAGSLFELKRVKVSGKDKFLAFKLRIKHGKRGWKK